MSLRLGAALCGAAFMFCCSQSAIAKTSRSGHEAKLASTNSPKGIEGKASTYNPLQPGDSTAGGLSTASGEKYNPNDWTAAIQTTLRHLFGGVTFGKSYRPVFVLVEAQEKKAIVRINDVGPLKPGRVIDLNDRVMRYFDPSMGLGVLPVKVTPLAGDHVPGPTNMRLTS
jgi:peptidoglycan lytic transglycosylase